MEDLEQACKEIFQLPFPPNEEQLKKKYRELTRKGWYRHPDLGGDHDKFVRMDLVYRSLVPWAVDTSTNNHQEVLIMGKKLSEFGQGLGPTTNGVICTKCSGKGYGRSTRRVPDKSGPYVLCFVCQGKPFGSIFMRGCYHCENSGRQYTRKIDHTDWWQCWDCEGTGEIYIMNPVLRKGAIG